MAEFVHSRLEGRLPGYVGTALCVLVTTLWTSWGVVEMFHEGWYRPFEWLFFLLPAGVCLVLTLVALTWPRLGGWLLMAVGGVFYAGQLWRAAARYRLTLNMVLSWFPVSGLLLLVGLLFLLEGRRKRSVVASADSRWWRRNLRYLIAIGVPFLLGIGLSIEPAIRVSSRVDDGYRGERLIEGNGVVLTWAPTGPGWVTGTAAPAWNEIALYGVTPVGFAGKEHGHGGQCNKDTDVGCPTATDMQRYNVCRYLSEDGTRLMDAPQGFWRMPTTDELVRSLVRHGQNARCTWDGEPGRAQCKILPDKETPLWDPKAPVIYYWSADEHDAALAYKVAYNGRVDVLHKFSGLGSCGYRCVRSH